MSHLKQVYQLALLAAELTAELSPSSYFLDLLFSPESQDNDLAIGEILLQQSYLFFDIVHIASTSSITQSTLNT